MVKWYDPINKVEWELIPKSELEDGATYSGHCRNASKATWHADKNCFTYSRRKFGTVFDEDIKHPEDDDGYDVFVPQSKLEIGN